MEQLAFDEFDFGGGQRADYSDANVAAVLRYLSRNITRLSKMEMGRLTDRKAKKILDYLKSDRAVLAFYAALFLDQGRVPGDFESFANDIRLKIRLAYRLGKVRGIGQPRNRSKKPKQDDDEGEGL